MPQEHAQRDFSEADFHPLLEVLQEGEQRLWLAVPAQVVGLRLEARKNLLNHSYHVLLYDLALLRRCRSRWVR